MSEAELKEQIAKVIADVEIEAVEPVETWIAEDECLAVVDQIHNLYLQAGYLPVGEVQLEVLGEESIKQILAIQALEVLGHEFLKSYTLDDALDGSKRVSQATIAHGEAKGQLFRVKGENEKW